MNGLLEKYHEYYRLVGCRAEYELEDGTIIELKYEQNGFAHLIGMHKLKDIHLIQLWQDSSVGNVRAKEVIRNIKNEKLTEREVMNSKFFPVIKDRYDRFSYDNLTTLNYTDAIVNFDANMIGSKIKSNYILFEETTKGEYNHMGIVYKPDVEEAYIETFFYESKDTYIKGQKVVKVKSLRIVDACGRIIVEDSF